MMQHRASGTDAYLDASGAGALGLARVAAAWACTRTTLLRPLRWWRNPACQRCCSTWELPMICVFIMMHPAYKTAKDIVG